MSEIDYAVLFLIAAAIGIAVGKIYRDRKSGNCQGCLGCHKHNKK